MILGIMHPGVAFLVMVGVIVLLLVGLMASGIIKVDIEVCDDDEMELELERIRALDDSTLKNRLLKWLGRVYEKVLEKEKSKQKKKGKK